MKRRTFVQSLMLFGTTPYLLASPTTKMNKQMSIQLLRHATVVITMKNLKLLVDPMLSPKDAFDPVKNCGNDIRIPMVELPVSPMELNKILNDVDAIVVTHTHRDHWDATAQKLIDKNKPVFCQPCDIEKIKGQGFNNVVPIDTQLNWEGITINRAKGEHGTGEIGKKMGEVSGFVFTSGDESVYVAGDTIWCEDVEKALSDFRPKVTVLNAGGARFLTGGPITMTPNDIMKVHEKLPGTKIIAVHMDTLNHCFIRRTDLSKALAQYKLTANVRIPNDGEIIEI